MAKTHKLIIGRKEVIYIDYDQAKNIFKQKEGGDIVTMKNNETFLHRRFYSREVELIPLNDIEKIIENIENELLKNEAILFLENRKDEKKYVSSLVLKDFLKKSWLII